MTKVYRLSHADFDSIKPISKAHGAFFIAATSKSPDSKPRFACVVSKKTASKAFQRVLIKRRCRAAVRATGLRQGVAVVFTAKNSAFAASYAEIARDVDALLEKLGSGLNSGPELQ